MSWQDSEEIPEDMELSLSESTEDLEDTLSMSEDDLSSDVDEECRGYKNAGTLLATLLATKSKSSSSLPPEDNS